MIKSRGNNSRRNKNLLQYKIKVLKCQEHKNSKIRVVKMNYKNMKQRFRMKRVNTVSKVKHKCQSSMLRINNKYVFIFYFS